MEFMIENYKQQINIWNILASIVIKEIQIKTMKHVFRLSS